MVNAVPEDGAPQNLADRHRSGAEEGNSAIEVRGGELADASDGLAMDPLVAGRKPFDRPRALDVRRSHAHGELALLDAVTDVGIAFCQVPRQFSQRSTASVRSAIVLPRRQRRQQS